MGKHANFTFYNVYGFILLTRGSEFIITRYQLFIATMHTPYQRLPLDDTIKAQVEPQERSKRDRENGQPSQGIPRPVMRKRKQVLKGRTANNGDKTAVQTGIEQYGCGPTAGGGTQKRQAKERQQPSQEEEEEVHNRVCMTELTQTTALPGATVREGRAEGQDVVGGPRPITRQEHLLTSGE